jgi:ribosomal protein S18 acetylase RimI-like enzyme
LCSASASHICIDEMRASACEDAGGRSMHEVVVRHGTHADAAAIHALYAEVARTPGDLAREFDEVTPAYVEDFTKRSLADGILVVAELADIPGLAAELHAYRNGLRNFSHVLGSLTVAVHPSAQGHGIGRRPFDHLIAEVRSTRPGITRIELIAQESNQRAIGLYESIGFRREGRFEGGIRHPAGGLEADIPMAWLC